MNIIGKTFSNFCIEGILTTDKQSDKGILVLSELSFDCLQYVEHFQGIILINKLSELSHELLLLKDMQITLVYDSVLNPDLQSGKKVIIYSKDNVAKVVNHTKDVCAIVFEKKRFAMSSSIVGMKHYLGVGAKIAATRGEFIMLPELKIHPCNIQSNVVQKKLLEDKLTNVLSFAAQNFEKVIYRFSDFSGFNLSHLSDFSKYEELEHNPSIGERGTHRLLHKHRDLFLLELSVISNLSKKYSNIVVLFPFVRSVEEAMQAQKMANKAIKKKIAIGCMVEVPILLFCARQLSSIFDFFVVGTKDLTQLMTGADRDNSEFSYSAEKILANVILNQFLKNVSPNKDVYITSKIICGLLKKQNVGKEVYCLHE